MTYSDNDIYEIRLKAQCCFPVLTYNLILAGKLNDPCYETLALQVKMLEYYINALKHYKPLGYAYTVNDAVFYTQTADDECLSTEDLQWVIEGIRGICQCSSCIDVTELLNDI
jgi:hypothetical protein